MNMNPDKRAPKGTEKWKKNHIGNTQYPRRNKVNFPWHYNRTST